MSLMSEFLPHQPLEKTMNNKCIAVVGGGPAGLMAAEVIAKAGYQVEVFDAMPSVGRKFLLAGVGGMNITHSENPDIFLTRYDNDTFADVVREFDSASVCDWIHKLGIDTFVGSSGRVFPKAMKAAPLLRAWLHRLRDLGVKIHARHRWCGWDKNGHLQFQVKSADGLDNKTVNPTATVLALGGSSWKKLGSNGDWVPLLTERGVGIRDLLPSNCGFLVPWSAHFQCKFAGEPLMHVGISCTDINGFERYFTSQLMISDYGVEGTGIYAISRYLREQIVDNGMAKIVLDLLPNFTIEQITTRLRLPKGKASMSNFLRKQLKLSPLHIALLYESQLHEAQPDACAEVLSPTPALSLDNPERLAKRLKHIEIPLIATRPIDEAISSAGGVMFSSLTQHFMLKACPGVFCAGEMLDWEAPTGGYLLTGCFASGVRAAEGVLTYLHTETTVGN